MRKNECVKREREENYGWMEFIEKPICQKFKVKKKRQYRKQRMDIMDGRKNDLQG